MWLNPPYAQPLIQGFCERVADEYAVGGVAAACVLTNNASETGWFQGLVGSASAACFPRGRIKFWHLNRESVAPLQGQTITYFGTAVDVFAKTFGAFGVVLTGRRS